MDHGFQMSFDSHCQYSHNCIYLLKTAQSQLFIKERLSNRKPT